MSLCPLNGASPTPENIKALDREIESLDSLPNNEKPVRAIKGLKALRSNLQDRLQEEKSLRNLSAHPLRNWARKNS